MKALAGEQRKLASLFGAGYLVCAGWLLWRERRRGDLGLETLISALVVGFGPAVLFAWLAHINILYRVNLIEGTPRPTEPTPSAPKPALLLKFRTEIARSLEADLEEGGDGDAA